MECLIFIKALPHIIINIYLHNHSQKQSIIHPSSNMLHPGKCYEIYFIHFMLALVSNVC